MLLFPYFYFVVSLKTAFAAKPLSNGLLALRFKATGFRYLTAALLTLLARGSVHSLSVFRSNLEVS